MPSLFPVGLNGQIQLLLCLQEEAETSSGYRMFHSRNDNKCSLKQPDLYVWNSGNEKDSFPEIPAIIKIEIPQKQECRSF